MIEIYASMDPNRYVPAPFSRAPYYLLVKPEGSWYIENPYKDDYGSVSERVIEMLKAYNPDVVYAGDFGPKAQYWLRENGIRFEVKK